MSTGGIELVVQDLGVCRNGKQILGGVSFELPGQLSEPDWSEWGWQDYANACTIWRATRLGESPAQWRRSI